MERPAKSRSRGTQQSRSLEDRLKRKSVALVVLLLASMLVAPAAHATRIHARALLPKLHVRAEMNVGYDRSKFTLWIDGNHDGCDTRAEVLKAESRVRVTTNSYCTVLTGRWVSVFDGKLWIRASDVDIDHHVPLAEAWGSGARRWSSTQRMRYANDLGYPGSLNAMTDNLNSSKSDGGRPRVSAPKKSLYHKPIRPRSAGALDSSGVYLKCSSTRWNPARKSAKRSRPMAAITARPIAESTE